MKFPQQQHGLIYADPAWEYLTRSDKGLAKSPQQHYKCMSLDEMKAMRDDIIFATAPDCICVMWTMWCFMDQALELMEYWGFEYVTGGVWNKLTKHGKQTFGTGYVMRGSSEPFIIGKFGNPKLKPDRKKNTRDSLFTGEVPENLHDLDNIMINALRREHSRKPDEMYDVIEKIFHGDYLELFARNERKGWTSWGDEVGKYGEVT